MDKSAQAIKIIIVIQEVEDPLLLVYKQHTYQNLNFTKKVRVSQDMQLNKKLMTFSDLSPLEYEL